MIVSFRSRVLKRFWTKGDASGIRPEWRERVRYILDALRNAEAPQDMNLIGLGLHPLKGDRAGEWGVTVSRNWRITFKIEDGNAVDIGLEDYH